MKLLRVQQKQQQRLLRVAPVCSAATAVVEGIGVEGIGYAAAVAVVAVAVAVVVGVVGELPSMIKAIAKIHESVSVECVKRELHAAMRNSAHSAMASQSSLFHAIYPHVGMAGFLAALHCCHGHLHQLGISVLQVLNAIALGALAEAWNFPGKMTASALVLVQVALFQSHLDLVVVAVAAVVADAVVDNGVIAQRAAMEWQYQSQADLVQRQFL